MDDVRKAKVRGDVMTGSRSHDNNKVKMATVDGKASVAFAEI